ncbi:DUF1572 family protein [Flagellimonas allohymeniacidonis]|uniref:DUF1572 domain-containing protein n=1 Tax=Flagellimonas allohymeniacidonis TaxID=2517819 RepID=A0A4Q8QIN1_9FLAO|nr:DUF1572 family protein [Allomuricauda hymeniacidonis]TAI48289.1 DUF1572 domain-containing protein [Allomuricauda hymeniacidonis]
MNFAENYLANVTFEFKRYKTLGDRTFAQLSEKEIYWRYQESDNSIAIIVKHMVGNMLSRWTNFLIEDGEKVWRDREMEFEGPYSSKDDMLVAWEKGWNCLFEALNSIDASNFSSRIKIRDQKHTLPEAINRQLAHYSNHVGQIVYVGKMIKGSDWESLSIPKGKSEDFNKKMFK